MAEGKGTDLNIGLIVTIGVITILLIGGVMIPGVMALQAAVQDQYAEQSLVGPRNTDRIAAETTQRKPIIGPPRWVDREKQWVTIPIDQAMELYAERHAGAAEDSDDSESDG